MNTSAFAILIFLVVIPFAVDSESICKVMFPYLVLPLEGQYCG